MFYNESIFEIYKKFNCSSSGLTSEEAKKRLEANGKNKLAEKKPKSAFVRFISQFKDYMVIFLMLAAVASMIIGIVMKTSEEFFDALVIAIIVLLNALIGFLQEGKAERALVALKKMSVPFAKVLRDGKIIKIKTEDVVVGDVVILEAGDVVCADIRLLESVSLKIEESALTGESVPSEKDAKFVPKGKDVPIADRKNMAFSSCTVTIGRGKGVVVATAMETQTGKIASLLNEAKEESTPLQKKLDKIGKVIGIGVLIIAAIIFLIQILTNLGNLNFKIVLLALETAIVLAVAAIPEGLPAVITIVMALGILKLSKQNAIVKKLTAVETLGSTEFICTDKTGTLTLNKMTVKELEMVNKTFNLDKTVSKAEISDLLMTMVLCNDSVIENRESKQIAGDPTETALIALALEYGLDKTELDKKFKRVLEKPFDSDRKRMSTVNEYEKVKRVYCKGGVDEVLSVCTKIMVDGKVATLTKAYKDEIINKNNKMAERALRVLGYATKEYKEGTEIESDLVFLGLSGMIDPPREEVTKAVETCKAAGIKVVMITGDHKNTAIAIAKKIGILTDGDMAITGKELDAMTDAEFKLKILKIKVYARVSPENKVRIVKTLKSLDKVVAMTGDGVNDAPSIKNADIGIGMGITGTEVTKSAANMILADDNFGTIVTAVKEGRKIFSNIQKAILFLLSGNLCEVLALFIVVLFFPHLSFLVPVQLLWVNLVTDSFPALAFSTLKADKNLLSEPPRKKNKGLFADGYGYRVVLHGIVLTGLVLGSFFIGTAMFGNKAGSTMALITLNFVELFNTLNVASGSDSIFTSGVLKNWAILGAIALGMGLTGVIICVPFINMFFQTACLNIVCWAIAAGFALAIIPIIEISKLVEKAIMKKRQGKVIIDKK